MTPKQIKSWRIVFATAVAAFELSGTIARISGGQGLDERGNQLLSLHRQGLSECEKESPDIDVIGSLITQMEIIASQKDAPNFQPGGISKGWIPNDLAPGARVISREENERLKAFSMPQTPALKNAVNRQARIDELVYLARKAGNPESDISDCLSDILSPLSVEQRLNKLIG